MLACDPIHLTLSFDSDVSEMNNLPRETVPQTIHKPLQDPLMRWRCARRVIPRQAHRRLEDCVEHLHHVAVITVDHCRDINLFTEGLSAVCFHMWIDDRPRDQQLEQQGIAPFHLRGTTDQMRLVDDVQLAVYVVPKEDLEMDVRELVAVLHKKLNQTGDCRFQLSEILYEEKIEFIQDKPCNTLCLPENK